MNDYGPFIGTRRQSCQGPKRTTLAQGVAALRLHVTYLSVFAMLLRNAYYLHR